MAAAMNCELPDGDIAQTYRPGGGKSFLDGLPPFLLRVEKIRNHRYPGRMWERGKDNPLKRV
jgi:hypothetical protein